MSVGVGELKTVRKQIKTSLIRNVKPISILIPTKETDYKMIKSGFMPNFVHSLDASNIHLLIKNIKNLKLNNLNLYTIHDCFASDYLTIELIELLVKISFVELYFNQNYLNNVHESFISLRSPIEDEQGAEDERSAGPSSMTPAQLRAKPTHLFSSLMGMRGVGAHPHPL
jgi:DNA-directed RNA polymerase